MWHRSSRHERGYGTAWDRLRVQILKRDCYLCQCSECKVSGRIRPARAVDHILPKAQGGTDEPGNLQAINDECHQAKTVRDNLAMMGCEVSKLGNRNINSREPLRALKPRIAVANLSSIPRGVG